MGKVTRCKRQDRKKRVLSCFQFYCKTFIITMLSNYSSLEFNLTKYKIKHNCAPSPFIEHIITEEPGSRKSYRLKRHQAITILKKVKSTLKT